MLRGGNLLLLLRERKQGNQNSRAAEFWALYGKTEMDFFCVAIAVEYCKCLYLQNASKFGICLPIP